MDERTRAAWGATAAVAVGGLWLLFIGGLSVETVLVAIVAAAGTFLGLELRAAWRSRRRH